MTKHLAEHVRLILSRISLCAVLAAACLDQAESSERARLKPDTQQTRSATGKLDRNPGTATLENSTLQAVLEKNPQGLCFGHGELTTISLTDWETGLGSWVAGQHPLNPATFSTPDWAVVQNLPSGRSGKAAFVANRDNLDTCLIEDEFGALTLESPDILIPPGTAVPRIAIDHWIATEEGYDGGNFKISVDGGDFILVPPSAIELSPYNGTLYPADRPNSNPLAGEPAFTGSDDGTTGSWGQSNVNLFGIAQAGSTVRLRFDFGIDDCDGLVGWYVDDVRVYSCSAELPPSDCGNGVLDDGEECDDGNTYIQDGCSNTCQVEDGWQCTLPTPPAISDPGFEATEILGNGTLANAFWTEYSLNFDNAVICSELYCGTLTGSGAANGDYWAWLGGYLGGYEEARLSQVTTIPATASELTFALEVSGTCVSYSDYVELLVDGVREFYVNASSPLCGNLGYTVQTVDLCDYADGGVHTIEFHAETFGPTDLSLFFIDDVQIPGTPSVCTELSLIFIDGFESKSGPCP